MAEDKEVLLTAGDIGLPLLHRGKVREVFDGGDNLVFVATDRISAFDVVFAEGVPGKGRVLTELSALWFAASADVVPNHFVTMNVDEMPALLARGVADGQGPSRASPGASLEWSPDTRRGPDLERRPDSERRPGSERGSGSEWRSDSARRPDLEWDAQLKERLRGRTTVGRKTERVDVECVVRGYLSGSGWAEYKKSGEVCGIPLPPGLRLNEKLPEPIFTPALKVDDGHDVNVSFEEVASRYGSELAADLRDKSMALYEFGAARARTAGLILADTKFEFGLLDGRLIVIDELLTPDSSRFWPEDRYEVGRAVDSLDKQPVRDYLQSTGWNKQPPPPPLPPAVVAAASARYEEVLRRLQAVLVRQ